MKYREGGGNGRGRGGVGMDRSGWIAGVGQGEENKNRGSGGVNQGVRCHHLNMVSNTRKGPHAHSASMAALFLTLETYSTLIYTTRPVKSQTSCGGERQSRDQRKYGVIV